jgi:indole-3-glycerol phosphate synthase
MPFLFKDFVATEYQVRLARALGASSVLLMTQLLEKEHLKDLYELALSLELTPFVETHHLGELEWALELEAKMIGINARDFSTKGLPIDLSTTPRRIEEVGALSFEGRVLVAQSGLETEGDLNNLLDHCPKGLPHAVQIGSALGKAEGVPTWVGRR